MVSIDVLSHYTHVFCCFTSNSVWQSTPLDLIETGKSLKVQAERPHLVSLGSGRLSTAITLLPLLEGKITSACVQQLEHIIIITVLHDITNIRFREPFQHTICCISSCAEEDKNYWTTIFSMAIISELTASIEALSLDYSCDLTIQHCFI